MIEAAALPPLQGARTNLRALTENDLESLYAIFSNPEVTRYWSHPPFTDESQALEYLEEVRKGCENRTFLQWGVCRRSDPGVIGTCTLWQLDHHNLRAEIGFALAREHWGRGWMTDALTVMIEHAFVALGLRRLEADVDPDKRPSIALLERFGFRREGYMRERWLVGGATFDSVFMALLRKDWSGEGAD